MNVNTTHAHAHAHAHTHMHARTDSSNVEGNKLPKDLTPQDMIRTRVLLVEPDGQKWTSDPPPPQIRRLYRYKRNR